MSDVKSLFKTALAEIVKTGGIEKLAGMGWLDKKTAKSLQAELEGIENTLRDGNGETGIRAYSFVGLLGPLTEHEPVLSCVLLSMLAAEAVENAL